MAGMSQDDIPPDPTQLYRDHTAPPTDIYSITDILNSGPIDGFYGLGSAYGPPYFTIPPPSLDTTVVQSEDTQPQEIHFAIPITESDKGICPPDRTRRNKSSQPTGGVRGRRSHSSSSLRGRSSSSLLGRSRPGSSLGSAGSSRSAPVSFFQTSSTRTSQQIACTLPQLPLSQASNTMKHFLKSCNGWIPVICNTVHEVTAFMGEVDLFPNDEYIMWLLVKFASDISDSLEKGNSSHPLIDSKLIQCLEYIDQDGRSITLTPQGPPRFCMEFVSGLSYYFPSPSCV
jgi:hypothetical protein